VIKTELPPLIKTFYLLTCPAGHVKKELTQEDARFLVADKNAYRIPLKCSVCGQDLEVKPGRQEEVIG
jgi:hypothetical protein